MHNFNIFNGNTKPLERFTEFDLSEMIYSLAKDDLSELRRAIAAAILKGVETGFEAVQRKDLNHAVGQLFSVFCHKINEFRALPLRNDQIFS